MFDEHGHLREAKTKSNLKNALRVEISERKIDKMIDTKFLDGCAVLWVITWPTNGKVHDFLNAFRRNITRHLQSCDVYLVFDR